MPKEVKNRWRSQINMIFFATKYRQVNGVARYAGPDAGLETKKRDEGALVQ